MRKLNPEYVTDYLQLVDSCLEKCDEAVEVRDVRDERLQDFVAQCLLPIIQVAVRSGVPPKKLQNITKFCLQHYNHDKVFAQGYLGHKLEALLTTILRNEETDLKHLRRLDPSILISLKLLNDAATENPLLHKGNLLVYLKILER